MRKMGTGFISYARHSICDCGARDDTWGYRQPRVGKGPPVQVEGAKRDNPTLLNMTGILRLFTASINSCIALHGRWSVTSVRYEQVLTHAQTRMKASEMFRNYR